VSSSAARDGVPTMSLEKGIAQLDLESESSTATARETTCTEIPLDSLIDNLPPAISYSVIEVPLTSDGQPTGKTAKILRRDLFDARFQLANEEDDSEDEGSAYGSMIPRSDSPPTGLGFGLSNNTDLVKGVYEGGLKTWEASLDLVDCLKDLGYSNGGKSIKGQRVLEVGCGTALPSLYLLEQLFLQLLQAGNSEEATATYRQKTVIHLQDYNQEVLLYITFCNILLAFWNAKQTAQTAQGTDVTPDTAALPVATKKRRSSATALSQDIAYSVDEDPETELNEIPLPEELIDSFLAFLKEHDIELKLFAGSWQTWPDSSQDEQAYDLVLTSETVYELENLDSLCTLLQRAATTPAPMPDQLTLVACKRVYFGVGGGELAFKDKVEKKAEVENIWTSSQGVERTVMRVTWKSS